MTDWLLAVDPGKRGCGCALWRRGELIEAGYVAPKERATTLGGAVEAMSASAVSWAVELSRGEIRNDGRLVIELPQTYGGRADKGDANTLIALGCVVGAIIGALGVQVLIVVPHTWKGTIGKPSNKTDYESYGYVVESRVRTKLSPGEQIRVVWPNAWRLRLDVADSVGIGLWALGRSFV